MSDFSIFDGAMSCIGGILATAPSQYQPPQQSPSAYYAARSEKDIPEQYKWKICQGIPHQGKDGFVKFGLPEVPLPCAAPKSLADMIGYEFCKSDH